MLGCTFRAWPMVAATWITSSAKRSGYDAAGYEGRYAFHKAADPRLKYTSYYKDMNLIFIIPIWIQFYLLLQGYSPGCPCCGGVG